MSSIQIQESDDDDDDDDDETNAKKPKITFSSGNKTMKIIKSVQWSSQSDAHVGIIKPNLMSINESDELWFSAGKRGADEPCVGSELKRFRTTSECDHDIIQQDEFGRNANLQTFEETFDNENFEEIEHMDSSDSDGLPESKIVDDFDKHSKYYKGQLNTNASFSYRTHFYLNQAEPSSSEPFLLRNATSMPDINYSLT